MEEKDKKNTSDESSTDKNTNPEAPNEENTGTKINVNSEDSSTDTDDAAQEDETETDASTEADNTDQAEDAAESEEVETNDNDSSESDESNDSVVEAPSDEDTSEATEEGSVDNDSADEQKVEEPAPETESKPVTESDPEPTAVTEEPAISEETDASQDEAKATPIEVGVAVSAAEVIKPTPEDDNTPTSNSDSAEKSDNASADDNTREVVVTTDDTQSTTSSPSQVSGETDNEAPVAIPITGGAKKSKLGLLIGVVFVVVLAILGTVFFLNLQPQKSDKIANNTPVKKDIPVLQVATFLPLSHSYYPDIENDTTVLDIQNQIFETLTRFENGTKLVPSLADSWTNPDNNTWVFKLHPDVKFHTGKTMTASDVKASIDSVKASEYGQTFASTIKSVDAVDPLTVKITTDGPDPLLANKLTGLYIYDTTSGKKDNPINGSGPYTVKSDTKDAITLAAFDGYHGGHVYTREVKYLGIQDSTKVPDSDLKNKTIQFMALRSDPKFAAKLKTFGYSEVNQDSYEVADLIINTGGSGKDKPLANVAVRKALAQALNIPKIISIGDAAGAIPATQTTPKGIPGYNPSIKAPVYSVENAKKALVAAGYPNGFSFKLTYFDVSPNKELVQQIKTDLAAIGVTVNPDPQTDQQALGDIAFGGKTDMFYAVLSSSLVDGSDVTGLFQGLPFFSNKSFNDLMTKASTELDPAKRVEYLQQAQKALSDDQDDIPLFQRQSFVFAFDPSIVVKYDTITSASGVYFWQTYAK